MATTLHEVERKYEVAEGVIVPDLTGVVEGATVGPVQEHALHATYFDTSMLRLRSARLTLRHRAGGPDAGWHLKLPAARGRTELQVPGELEDGVPPELAALVRAVVRSDVLGPVAELQTLRTVYPVQQGDRRLAEVVDDRVEARLVHGGDDTLSWREWECELVDGDDALLDAVQERLRAAGARRSGAPSKVGRVLDRHPAATADPGRRGLVLQRPATAGDVLRVHLARQVGELVGRDPQVRRDEPDAVHKMRVATRRLRSALQSFRPLFDREVTDPLRDELRWLAGSLGAARDAEVMHARLLSLLAEEPGELVLGPARATVDELLGRRYRTAHEHAVRDLDSARYLALLDGLDSLLDAPAFAPRAGKAATDLLPRLVRRSWRRLDSALDAAEALQGPAQDEALHQARRDAKRVRYACEAVEPVFGRDARRLARAVTTLQEVLGEHQDSVVTRQVLRELGAMSSRAGRNGFTFGRLHGLEQERARERSADWRQVRAEASRPGLHRWLH